MAVTKSAPLSEEAAVKKPTAAMAAAKTSAKRAAAKSGTPRSEPKPEKGAAEAAASASTVSKSAGSKASSELDAGGKKTEQAKQPAKARAATPKASTDAESAPRTVFKKTASGPRRSTKTSAAVIPAEAAAVPDQQEIDRMIAEAAYYLAEKRNFAPGWEQQDWETAKNDVMARLPQRHD